ncbi:unnamed protein product [Vicia faba]|uniref:Amidase domain-containing protein n=1 Tax=Vicia faba TaxID=3906 RepID=A0AAV0YR52_VICFA|nr:unnamed protein product [Vicia faba]
MEFVKVANGGTFHSSLYNRIISSIIHSASSAEFLIDLLTSKYFKYIDVSYFTFISLEKLARNLQGKDVSGEPISVLDGVLVAIKDEIDCLPYPTTGGTKWLHKQRPCLNDACCVKRLRLCGTILVGKTNMHELGAGTSGINPHYGASRNPYDVNRIAGGSSSGSSSVVSAGLCPIALGVDGGGSVRMPAALCGVVGLKPTFGRIPHDGVLPLNWTVGMVGILAGTVEDSLIALKHKQCQHRRININENIISNRENPVKPEILQRSIPGSRRSRNPIELASVLTWLPLAEMPSESAS